MQYENKNRVRISGLELAGAFETGLFFGRFAGQIIDGVDLNSGDVLSEVPPDQIVLTAGLHSPHGRGEYELRYTSVGSKEGGSLPSDAWQTLDLFATRDLGGNATLAPALNNILNETYTPYL